MATERQNRGKRSGGGDEGSSDVRTALLVAFVTGVLNVIAVVLSAVLGGHH
jgi:hypothetical protein